MNIERSVRELAANRKLLWLTVLAACVLASGTASLLIGKDINWDLRNYHYYNAYAFVNDRLLWDIGPAQIQGFFNPIGDLPFYFLVQAVSSPAVIAFAMAATTGVGAFFLVRISMLLFTEGEPAERRLAVISAVVVGLSGAAGVAMIGSTMNEWPSTALVIASLYVLLASTVRADRPKARDLAVAGLLAGIATGLKLTYGVYALGLWVAAGSSGTLPERLRRWGVFGFFLFLGVALSYGWWGTILYREFGNPFFPLYNAWFRSPFWEPVNFFDRYYGPRNVLQAIAFPLAFARDSNLVSEQAFRDYRLPALFVLSLLCAAKYVWTQRARPQPPSSAPMSRSLDRAWGQVGVFALVSYLAWLKMFGIYRYVVPLELAAGPLIVACIAYLVGNRRWRQVAIVLAVLLLVPTVQRVDWGRTRFGDEYFPVRVPPMDAQALVVMGRWEPMSYIIPFFPRDARFVAPVNLLLDLDQKNLLVLRAEKVIAGHDGSLYSLDYAIHERRTDADLLRLGLARDPSSCTVVESKLDENAMRLCRVKRVAAVPRT